MTTLGLLVDVALICGCLAALVAVAAVSYHRVPRPDPRRAASKRPAGQTDRSAERTSIERDIEHEPSIVFSALRMAANDVGLAPTPDAVGPAAASKADITQLVEELEVHLDLDRPDRN